MLTFCVLAYAQETDEPQNPRASVKLPWSVIQDWASTMKGYPISNMMDGDPATAWAGDLTVTYEDGTKELDGAMLWGDSFYGFKIKVEGESLDYLRIINGYAKSKSTFVNNSRPASFVIFDGRCEKNDGGEMIGVDGELSEPMLVVDFEDTSEPQIIKFNEGFEGVTTIWLCISDVYEGAKYYDNCISELEFYGKPRK